MAQAQSGASARRSNQQSKSSTRSRGSNKSKKGASSKAKRSSNQASNGQSKEQASKPSPVSVVENTAKDAGKTVGRAASKAKVPLLAGGAALAGAAGGIALGARQARRHRGIGAKVKSEDLAKAAKKVGSFGAQMGRVAGEVQRAREDSNGKSRSPVEVVLEGLTARRERH